MKQWWSLIPVVLFLGLTTLFGVLGVVLPDEEYTATEGRLLTQRPEGEEGDTLGDTTAQWTDYVVDQFPYREEWLRAYSMLELGLGKHYTRDTYVTGDGWLMTRIYQVQPEQREQVVQAVADAAGQTDVPLLYAVIPQKNDMLAHLAAPWLDNRVSDANKAALLEELAAAGVGTIDVGADLLRQYTAEEREGFYYRTDFHWNHRGAFYAAQAIAGHLTAEGLLDAPLPQAGDFVWQELGQERLFQGDLNRRFSNLLSMREDIPLYTPADPSARRYYWSVDDSRPAQRAQIIGTGLTQQTVDYNGLSTANLGYYRVVNPDARTDQTLLIVKDSYQNPTTDYWSELFYQVVVIDPREYAEPYSFSQLLEEHGVDLVLLWYHQGNASAELVDFLSAA